MTTALATRDNVTALAAPTITAEQMDLIRKTVARDATPDELKLYLYDCARQGVHPLDKLIHFTKRSGKYTPVTSIDFMRMRAAETNEYAGSDVPLFAGEDGVWGSLWIHDAPPKAAMVTVWRLVQGTRCKFEAVARWAEYKPESNDFMWKKMPATMLAKCAEALSLRKGFPKQLAGLYAREEMAQADSAPALVVEAPKPAPEVLVAGRLQSTVDGDLIDNHTGELVAEVPAGYVLITKCEDLAGKGKKRGNVTFSDGITATVWNQDSQLFDVCMDVCQRSRPVTRTLKEKEGYAPTLKGIRALDADHDQRRIETDPPIAIDASEIPF